MTDPRDLIQRLYGALRIQADDNGVYRQLLAEARAYLAAHPEPAAGLPPRPPLQSPASRSELVRYGVTWDGSPDKPLLTPMPDGYWTPWHIAAQSPGPEPAADGPAVPDGREPASVTHEPSDEEVNELANEYLDWNPEGIRAFARAVLARYGNQPPQPIPLSERLPSADDCDGEGRCWWGFVGQWGDPHEWQLLDRAYASNPLCGADVWLPHHALPLPEVKP